MNESADDHDHHVFSGAGGWLCVCCLHFVCNVLCTCILCSTCSMKSMLSFFIPEKLFLFELAFE